MLLFIYNFIIYNYKLLYILYLILLNKMHILIIYKIDKKILLKINFYKFPKTKIFY